MTTDDERLALLQPRSLAGCDDKGTSQIERCSTLAPRNKGYVTTTMAVRGGVDNLFVASLAGTVVAVNIYIPRIFIHLFNGHHDSGLTGVYVMCRVHCVVLHQFTADCKKLAKAVLNGRARQIEL